MLNRKIHFDSENMFNSTKEMIHFNAVTEKLNTSRRVKAIFGSPIQQAL